jgi:hypothetical protein
MIGKVKKWLGIEGVKLELDIPATIQRDGEMLYGKIRFTSLHAQTISSYKIILIEKYSRGRKDDKLTDEYELGQINIDKVIEVPAEGTVEVPFQLPFRVTNSEMDDIEDSNILSGLMVKAVKYIENVDSEFRVEAEATVGGVALNPFDKKTIEFV